MIPIEKVELVCRRWLQDLVELWVNDRPIYRAKGDDDTLRQAQRLRAYYERLAARAVAVLLVLLLTAAPLAAEGTPFLWSPPHRGTANALSWGTVWGAVALDTVRSVKADNRRTALLEQGCGLAVAGLAMRTTKHFVHRDRPDGSDNRSFYSGHTTYTAVSAGRGWEFAVLVPATAILRQAAGKHYPSDTIVGALAGGFARWSCRKVIQ